ncbi:MAG TPA: phosphoribosylformylglycinamidine synthase I [Candidatus Gracilibacteria bacterium]
MPPKVLILSGYGINCEEETAFAFTRAGGSAELVHINDLIESPERLKDFQIFMIPGGFSYGDHTGAGKGMANKILNNLREEVLHFVKNRDTLTLGICNGFQVLASLGLVPALDGKYGERQVALIKNDSDRYQCQWVKLKNNNPDGIFTRDMNDLYCPIAHGEGKVFAEASVLDQLEAHNQIAFTYTDNPHDPLLPQNPNGSLRDIAGITDQSGRVLGMMPHPERSIFFHQRPDFTNLRETLIRNGEALPYMHDGIKLFENAISYFQ